MKNNKYDVIIVGAGPAGLFAAYELTKTKKKILLIDKGKFADKRHCPISDGGQCKNCSPCHIMCGYGGAGTFSDGKLNFIPKLGKTNLYEFMSKSEAQNLIDYSENIFNNFEMDSEIYPSNIDEANQIKEKAVKEGLDLLLIKQKHLGSDNLPTYITNFTNYLKKHNVDILESTEVISVDTDISTKKKNIITKKDKFSSENVILAPGRVGADWIQNIANELKLEYFSKSIEIGVRVEVRNEIMKELCNIIYDPTFFVKTPTYDDECRTFCTNPGGYVTKENYGDFIGVNGHALKNKKSNNTNFAFLTKIDLTEPVSNTREFGKSIAKLAHILGDGKPILQRVGDLKNGKRSTWNRIDRSFIEPTLKECVPGDLALILPHRVVTNIIEGLEQLNLVIPGVFNDETLLYAPEIKFFSIQIKTNKYFETNIDGLFTIGDGAGNSGNIVSAACTGLRVGQYINGEI